MGGHPQVAVRGGRTRWGEGRGARGGGCRYSESSGRSGQSQARCLSWHIADMAVSAGPRIDTPALGIPVATHKTEGPATCVTFLGILIYTQRFELRLPLDKVQHLWDLRRSWASRRACTCIESWNHYWATFSMQLPSSDQAGHFSVSFLASSWWPRSQVSLSV